MPPANKKRKPHVSEPPIKTMFLNPTITKKPFQPSVDHGAWTHI